MLVAEKTALGGPVAKGLTGPSAPDWPTMSWPNPAIAIARPVRSNRRAGTAGAAARVRPAGWG